MVENLKIIISEMDSKTSFVNEVADYYKLNPVYVMQNYFQAGWKIPTERVENILKMAQIYLYNQNTRQRRVLQESGFKGIK